MTTHRPIHVIILLLLISGWSLLAHASTPSIGKVILAVGEVTAMDPSGKERKLERRSKIFTGDTLVTRAGSRCQIRFSDKSLVALTADSQFKVDEYQFDQTRASDEKAIYSLLKGGMRAISGAIGKTNQEDYQLNTPVATIGIRGTAFNIGLIEESGNLNLYGTVDAGTIIVKNEQGELLITPGQNFHVPMNQPPKQILVLPESFPSNDEAATEDEGGTEESGDTDTSTEDGLDDFSGSEGQDELIPDGTDSLTDPLQETAQTDPAADPTITSNTDILTPTTPNTDIWTPTGTLAPGGAAVGFSFIGQDLNGTSNKSTIFTNTSLDEIYIDTVSGIDNVPVAGSFTDLPDCNPCRFMSGTGTLVTADTGGTTTTGVNWGRWTGSYEVIENGVAATPMGDFHYIYSPNVTPATVLQNLTGALYYASPTGTLPTDQNGATGTLNSLSMFIDFSNQTVTDLYLSVTTPATGLISAYALSAGSLAIPLSDLTGNGIAIDAANGFDAGTSGLNGYVGEIQGTFVGLNAEGLMTTYGFREVVTNPSTNAVSGAALIIEVGY